MASSKPSPDPAFFSLCLASFLRFHLPEDHPASHSRLRRVVFNAFFLTFLPEPRPHDPVGFSDSLQVDDFVVGGAGFPRVLLFRKTAFSGSLVRPPRQTLNPLLRPAGCGQHAFRQWRRPLIPPVIHATVAPPLYFAVIHNPRPEVLGLSPFPLDVGSIAR